MLPLGISVLGLLGLGVVAALVFLLVAFAQMVVISLRQWRDLFSVDRWTEVFMTIGRNKLRTALTAISIAWGILVLVFLLGLGRGLEHGLHHNFAREATNSVSISANKTSQAHAGYDVGRRISFDNRDYERARRNTDIDHITGEFYIKGQRWGAQMTKRNGKANAFQINAVHADAIILAKHDIVQGRFLGVADILQRRKAAVIGRPVAEFLFTPDENPIGQWITLIGVPFQVVGVYTDEAGTEEERQIYVPVSTAQLAFSGGDKLGRLQFTVGDASAGETKAIVDRVVADLADRHQFSPADKQAVRVHNNVEQFERFSKLFWIISTFVVLIGFGTLAAGVVGVSNIMMIAVKERTKEIGVRKALGATPRSVIFMIIQEAVFLTGIAGLLGLSAGVFLLDLIGRMDNDFIREPNIDLRIGVLATLGLIAAGALAGYFPARAAARVNPIHALRDQ